MSASASRFSTFSRSSMPLIASFAAALIYLLYFSVFVYFVLQVILRPILSIYTDKIQMWNNFENFLFSQCINAKMQKIEFSIYLFLPCSISGNPRLETRSIYSAIYQSNNNRLIAHKILHIVIQDKELLKTMYEAIC